MQRAKVIDPQFPKFLNKVFYILQIRDYIDSNGEIKQFYVLNQDPTAYWGSYFGKNQIELL